MSRLPALVLTGHDLCTGQTPPTSGPANTVISVDDLAAILEGLCEQGYRFVGLAEFLQGRRRGGVALLTFDDAYLTVAELALPLLARLGIPALMFVVTGGMLGRSDPFPHFMHALRDRWSSLTEEERETIDRHPAVQAVMSRAGHASLGQLLPLDTAHDAFAAALGPAALSEFAAYLSDSRGLARRTMALDDIRRALGTGLVELGAHSVTHRPFVGLDNAEIQREVEESTTAVADLCGTPAGSIAFAYPYGFVTAHAASAVERTCAAGFTCHERPLSPLDRRAMLPRVNLDGRTLQIARPRWHGASMLESLREETLLYARSDFGRRLTQPVRALMRAVRTD